MLAGCLHRAVERELVRKALGSGCANGHRWCLASLGEGRRFGAHEEANTKAGVDCWEDERCVSEMHPSVLEQRPQGITNQESPPSPASGSVASPLSTPRNLNFRDNSLLFSFSQQPRPWRSSSLPPPSLMPQAVESRQSSEVLILLRIWSRLPSLR